MTCTRGADSEKTFKPQRKVEVENPTHEKQTNPYSCGVEPRTRDGLRGPRVPRSPLRQHLELERL